MCIRLEKNKYEENGRHSEICLSTRSGAFHTLHPTCQTRGHEPHQVTIAMTAISATKASIANGHCPNTCNILILVRTEKICRARKALVCLGLRKAGDEGGRFGECARISRLGNSASAQNARTIVRFLAEVKMFFSCPRCARVQTRLCD